MRLNYLALAFCAISSGALADEYTLFNPVPADKMRPMSTERPSKSDSTTTLDAGHVQLETSLVNYTHNDDCIGSTCTRSNEWDAGALTTLRVGLTQSSEFQVLFDAYRNVTTTDRTNGTRTNADGFGDTTLRYKYNFWGNDGGDSAFAGVIYTKLPTNSDHLANNAVEGGIEFPFSITLKDDWSLGGMTQFNLLNEQGTARNYYMGYVNALYLSKNITEATSAYGEFYTYLPDTGSRDWQNTVDFGVVHKLTDKVQIDTGLNLGVTNAAPDAQWFAGIAYRF